MRSDGSHERLLDLLSADVPAPVWHRALAAALSASAVDPGEALVPDSAEDLVDGDDATRFEPPDGENLAVTVGEDDPASVDQPSTVEDLSDDSSFPQ